MTSSLQIQPDDAHSVSARLQQLTSELGLTPAKPDPVFPTGAATVSIHDNTTQATRTLQRRVETNSGRLRASADNYHASDQHNSSTLKSVDFKTGGGAPGAPAASSAAQRDATNRAALAAAKADIQRQLDVLQRQYDQLAASTYVRGAPVSSDDSKQLSSLKDQINSAKHRITEYQSVDRALGQAFDTYLLQFTNLPGRNVLAAVAVGDPDAAKNLAVLVPGMNNTVAKTLPDQVRWADDLRNMSSRQLILAGRDPSVSVISWMGYDSPGTPLNGDFSSISDGSARVGATDLVPFLEGLHDQNPGGHLTLLGHSYGSLVSGLALEHLAADGLHPVDDALFVGSPGADAVNPQAFGLPPGHAYAMNTPDDVVTNVFAPLAPLHGWGTDPNEMLPLLSTQAGVAPDGLWHPGASGHLEYYSPDSTGDPRMSQWNASAVIAGIPSDLVPATPPEYPLLFPPGPR